ncbi:MAG TPA: RHS repeat-associated core domain-containing protein [Oscillospiraceae bacterium]|nr:RHS repeat-associated core domain-containing protein [Oscillospiraceae bacterium]
MFRNNKKLYFKLISCILVLMLCVQNLNLSFIVSAATSSNTSDTTQLSGTTILSPSTWTDGPVTLNFTPESSGVSGVNNVLIGGRNLLRNSAEEKTGSNEFLQYADIAPIIDKYGHNIQYTISFDIKSADVSKKNIAVVYMQNGTSAKYSFGMVPFPVTTQYTRQTVVVTPQDGDSTQTKSMLAFYGIYGTGNILSVKNIKIEVGNIPNDYTYQPAPEDVNGTLNTTQTVSENGTYYFTVSDKANNVNTIPVTVSNIYKTTQCGTTTLSPSTWTNGSVTLNFKPTHTGDGGVNNVLIGGRNLLSDSAEEKTGSNEFLQYADIAPIIDRYGHDTQYRISFDIKSADVSKKNIAVVYMQNGTSAKYSFGMVPFPVTTQYTRQTVVVTPQDWDSTQTKSMLAFYGIYGTGNILSVKNIKIEVGNIPNDYTYQPAPEDVNGTLNTTQKVSENGTYYFTISDIAGNVTTMPVVVNNIDKVPPSISINTPNTWGETNKITANISDTTSGIAVQKWAIGKNLPASFFKDHGNSFEGSSFTVSENGIYTVYAKDNAGNETTESVTVDHVLSTAAVGNYTESFTDLSAVSPGMTVKIGRVYNSADCTDGPFGKGWTFSYAGSVKTYQYSYMDENGNLQTAEMPNLKVVKLPNGQSYIYQLINGSYSAYNTKDNLTQNSNGTFTFMAQDREYSFNVDGYLTAISDRNGNNQNISVDPNGNVQTVTDTAGRVYKIAYTIGRISSITDPIGREVKYTYTNGNLASVIDPMGITTVQYGYDDNGYLSQIKNVISKIIWSGTYDKGTDSSVGKLTSDTGSDGKSTTYSYDITNSVVTATDASGNQTTTTYNDNNLPTQVTNVWGKTTYSYDENGNKTSVTDSAGTKTYTYDGNGNLLSQKNTNGKMTYYQYDTKGNQILQAIPKNGTDVYSDTGDQSSFDITKYTYNKNGLVNTKTDPNGATITYTYDSEGNVLTQNNSVSGTTTSTYNGIGWATIITTPSGNKTVNTYDNDGNIIKSVCNTGTARYVYDCYERIVQQISPSEYDSAKDGLNNSIPVNTYSDRTVGYRYTYGNSGNISTETLPDNEILKFNSAGKVTSVLNPLNDTAVSNINYTYGNNGNILAISENGTQMVNYTYNSDSELTRENNVWQNESIVYTYDTNGNLLTKTVYPYTATDLTSITPTHKYNYQYENSSDSDQLTSYDGKAIVNDANGNMLAYNGWSYTWQNKQLESAKNCTNNISYQYNAAGLRTSKMVNGITTNYTFDDNNNITSETNGTDTINYTYDSNGKLQFMTLNGTKYIYETNAQGDVYGLVDSNNNEVVTYAYDSWGKPLSIGGSLAETVGTENHMRYRGYYYDTESGLYYLQSRYYNPELQRLISKDYTSYHDGQIGAAANLYTYANNNPVMNVDPSGHLAQIIIQF